MRVRCIETGRGAEGSIFVCETPVGDIILRAKLIGPYKYGVTSEHPLGKYKIILYASNRRVLRRKIEEWLEYELTKQMAK